MKLLEKISALAGKYFAILVIVVAVIAFLMPDSFSFLGQYITILLGVVMFGMGLTLKPVDFKLVLKNPLSVPGGTASNVMVYLARGNLPLSIIMTSFSTMLAPIFTPLLLLLLAGQWMPVDPISMFMSIIQVIIIPIFIGFIVRRLMPLTVD